MNPVLWAAMQSQDVLQQVDLMLPDLVDEKDLELWQFIQPFKGEVLESSWLQNAIDSGGVLTYVGVTMLMVPDALIYATGSYFGGPIGGVIAVVVWNGVAIGLILLDQVI